MEDHKILKAFYLISKELEEKLIKLENLELQLKNAKEHDDINHAKILLEEYQSLNRAILELKKKSEVLKKQLDL